MATLCWDALRVSKNHASKFSSCCIDRAVQLCSFTSLQKISMATSSLSHGAHALPSRHDSSITATYESLDRTTKIIKWFLRLHLALFYWNGTSWHLRLKLRFLSAIVVPDNNMICFGQSIHLKRPISAKKLPSRVTNARVGV